MTHLEKYNEMLVETNKAFNLTAHKTIEKSWLFNIQDSLLFNDEIAKYFKQGAKVIDLGSGSGSPAIPLKLSFPQINLTMIDSTFKKVKFLRGVLEQLKLDGEVIHARIEDYKGMFDIVTARAVAPLNELVKLGFPLLKRGGILIAYKGRNYQDEINSAKHILTRLRGKVIQIYEKALDADVMRSLVIIKKIS